MINLLPEFAIAFEQGDTPALVIGPVVVKDPVAGTTPFDLTQASVKLWLTAKKAASDADSAAIFQHTTASVAGGPGGITVNSPVSGDKNYATAKLTVADTTGTPFTNAFPDFGIDAPAVLHADVQLQEPDGTIDTIARGTITVAAQITRA